jgi:hypothetical protein
MAISQEEWDKLPDHIKREIHAHANAAKEAQQRLQKWDEWAEPNREILSRWPETVKKIREAEDKDADDVTFEEVQKAHRQRARETQEHRQYIENLSVELGQTRQQLEQIARGQQTTVSVAAHLAKWQSEDSRRDARELPRIAQEKNAQSFEDATRLYDEEVAKRQPAGNTRTVRFVRPGADESRSHRLNRDSRVSDEIMAALNAGDAPQSPTPMVWKKGHRAGSPVPELNSEGR